MLSVLLLFIYFIFLKSQTGFSVPVSLREAALKASYSERKSMLVCSKSYAEVESEGNLNSSCWWIQYKLNICLCLCS